jgi:hypothetical protein
MMAADYYIREPGGEWEAFERWENEGGRPLRNDEANNIDGRMRVAGGGQTSTESVSDL